MRPNALRAQVKAFASADPARLTVFLYSFGFKYGIPPEADFVFDVRFLPNPFYDPRLKGLSGLDPEVAEFLAADPMSSEVVADVAALVTRWLPRFIEDHRVGLTISIGCTGGQHRSVYLVEQLSKRFSKRWATITRHRELDGAGSSVGKDPK